MKNFQLLTSVGIAVIMVAGCAAVIGTLSGLALSFTGLSPLIIGGIVGSVPVLLLCMMSYNKFIDIDMVIQSIDEQLKKFNKSEDEESLKVLNGCLKERKKYLNSTGYYIRDIIEIGIGFGVGAGLVALGFTSPAAIGALTIIIMIAPIICIALFMLTNKAIECFSSKESEQPDGSLMSEVRVEEGSRILHP